MGLIQHGGHIKSFQRTLWLLSANWNVHSFERWHLLTSENIRLIAPIAESASHKLCNEEMPLLSCGSSMPNWDPIVHHKLAMILLNPLQVGMTRGAGEGGLHPEVHIGHSPPPLNTNKPHQVTQGSHIWFVGLMIESMAIADGVKEDASSECECL